MCIIYVTQGGIIMSKEDNKQLLTSSLYMEISTDKAEEISSLKEKKQSVIETLKMLQNQLKIAQEQKREINSRIRNLNYEIMTSKEKKFALSMDLRKQRRLANKLNNEITKEDSYINVSKFYPEKVEAKKR